MSLHPFSPDDLPPLTLTHFAWFEGDDAGDGTGLGCNRDYCDLRGLKLEDLRQILAEECRRIERLRAKGTDGPACVGCDHGCDECELEVEGLELGVASAVVALSVIGCIPYTSCNGGAFGGDHAADRLIVGFYMRPGQIAPVREAGRSAGVGLTNDRDGGVYVVSDSPQAMIAFAMRLGGLES